MLKLFHVFLLNINIGGDLLVFNVALYRNVKGFLVCLSFCGHHCAEE